MLRVIVPCMGFITLMAETLSTNSGFDTAVGSGVCCSIWFNPSISLSEHSRTMDSQLALSAFSKGRVSIGRFKGIPYIYIYIYILITACMSWHVPAAPQDALRPALSGVRPDHFSPGHQGGGLFLRGAGRLLLLKL